jgi:hypothetical protein
LFHAVPDEKVKMTFSQNWTGPGPGGFSPI